MAIAILTALTVIALRLILHATGTALESTDFMLVHFLAIVTTVFFAQLRLLRQDGAAAGYPQLIRDGFKSASLYALLMLLFLWWYYRAIEPEFFMRKVEALIFNAVEDGQDEAVVRPRITQFFTPFNYASMSFFALLAAGVANSLIIGAIHHKVLRRTRR